MPGLRMYRLIDVREIQEVDAVSSDTIECAQCRSSVGSAVFTIFSITRANVIIFFTADSIKYKLYSQTMLLVG